MCLPSSVAGVPARDTLVAGHKLFRVDMTVSLLAAVPSSRRYPPAMHIAQPPPSTIAPPARFPGSPPQAALLLVEKLQWPPHSHRPASQPRRHVGNRE